MSIQVLKNEFLFCKLIQWMRYWSHHNKTKDKNIFSFVISIFVLKKSCQDFASEWTFRIFSQNVWYLIIINAIHTYASCVHVNRVWMIFFSFQFLFSTRKMFHLLTNGVRHISDKVVNPYGYHYVVSLTLTNY